MKVLVRIWNFHIILLAPCARIIQQRIRIERISSITYVNHGRKIEILRNRAISKSECGRGKEIDIAQTAWGVAHSAVPSSKGPRLKTYRKSIKVRLAYTAKRIISTLFLLSDSRIFYRKEPMVSFSEVVAGCAVALFIFKMLPNDLNQPMRI